jgi:predicted MFS family arabinose efflux permease
MTTFVIYFYPFCMDIVVSLLLFVGRHSLASQGASEAVVGSIPLVFGAGYFLAGPVMRAVISRKHARMQMVAAVFGIACVGVLLALANSILLIQILFCIVPFGTSLFFNAFQSYMLGISTDSSRPLAVTVATYTFAWSMGFSLGPFVSGLFKNYFTWSQTYFIASAVSCMVGMIVLLYKPAVAGQNTQVKPAIADNHRPFVISGWISTAMAIIGWVVIATYWPVMAERAGFSSNVKGLIEFVYGASQGIAALVLLIIPKRHQQPAWLILFGALGITGLTFFGFSHSVVQFVLAAALYGVFASALLTFGVYHCMLDTEKASRRVAINEMVVGFGYVAGPIVASLCHHGNKPFSLSFGMIAGGIGLMAIMQIALAFRQQTVKS